jgi:hypothetical protein
VHRVIEARPDGSPRFFVCDDPATVPHLIAVPPRYDSLPATNPDGPKIAPPGIVRQAINFAGAVLNHVLSGEAASPELQAERLAICGACEHDVDGWCQVCGCNLSVKVSFAEQRCPLEPPKWGPGVPQERPAASDRPKPCCGGGDAS